MKRKTVERIQLFFQITGTIAAFKMIGSVGEVERNVITVGQAVVLNLLLILYILIAFASYHLIGGKEGKPVERIFKKKIQLR